MTDRGTIMEFWTICNKTILLIYVIITSYNPDIILSPWYTLIVLLYLSLNISIYIVKKAQWKPLFTALSILLIFVSAYSIHPMLNLLLPINIYEFASIYIRRNWILLLLMLTPSFFLDLDMLIQYGLIAMLCFAYYSLLKTYASKIERYRSEIENMRGAIDRLTKSLHKNNEWIRQFEYTFKLEERNRLSQEIHDKIGHSMTGALIQMEAAKRLITTDTGKSAELLQNAIQISKDGIESIRQVLKNMKPPTEQLGINRMRMLIDEFSSKHGIKTSLTHRGNVDLISPIQWKIIQENTQEALTNVLKYANATAVSVDIQVLNTLIKVEILDNGKGAQKVIKGLGIIGMEERTAAVNGTIIVDGSRGFSVTTLIPITNLSNPDV